MFQPLCDDKRLESPHRGTRRRRRDSAGRRCAEAAPGAHQPAGQRREVHDGRADHPPRAAAGRAVAVRCGGHGPGIADEIRDRVFEPFQQGSASSEMGGTGLGLAIARRHVELMGGSLGVESMPGHGSRFHFTLDLPASATPFELDSARGEIFRLAPGRHVRALVVDDVLENRNVLSAMLRMAGCDSTSQRTAGRRSRRFANCVPTSSSWTCGCLAWMGSGRRD